MLVDTSVFQVLSSLNDFCQSKYNGSEILFFVITGANPYPGMTRDQVIGQLHVGYRMPKPQYCIDEL